jgi:PAS domain S-box-containing protein
MSSNLPRPAADVSGMEQSNETYVGACAAAGVGPWTRDLANIKTLWLSVVWKDLLGYADDPRPDSQLWNEIVHEQDLKGVYFRLREQASSSTFQFMYRVRHKLGHWVRLESRARCTTIDGKTVVQGCDLVVDSPHEWRGLDTSILDALPALIWAKNSEFRFCYVNQAFADELGKTKDELIGLPDDQINDYNRQFAHFREHDAQVLKTGESREIDVEELTTKHKGVLKFATRKVRVALPIGTAHFQTLGVGTDITNAQRAAQRITEERQLLATLMDHVQDGIYVKDENLRFTYLNTAQARFFGVECAEAAIGKSDEDFFDKQLADRFAVEDRKLLSDGGAVVNMRRQFTAKDGSIQYRLVNKVAILDSKTARFTRIVGTSRDVTSLQQAEDQLRHDKELLAQILDRMPQCVFVKDRNGKYTHCNRSFAERGQRSAVEIIGTTDFNFWPSELANEFRRDDQAVMASDRPKVAYDEELFMRFPDGHVENRQFVTSKIPLHDFDGNVTGLLGIYEDVTDRRRIDRRKSDEAIARSISHCLNKWVAILEGQVLLFKLAIQAEPEALQVFAKTAAALARMESGVKFLKHATQVATNLSALSSSDRSAWTNLDLNRLLSDLIDQIQDPRIAWTPADVEIIVYCNPVYLSMAFVELLANARDFTPPAEQGGWIRVWIEFDVAHTTNQCTIHFQNNGGGISTYLRGRRIYDMFTAANSSRTGMGLAYVDRVATIHGGSIDEVGQPGSDAHFIFAIPVREVRNS